LTGFDSPTIQTLYIDREMNYQKLLQAFSRTNRIYTGKDSGLIVSFRKPFTMKENVQNTFRLFSNEKQNFDQLIPKEYEEVKKEFIECSTLYKQSEADLSDKALRSYDQYEEDFEAFSEVVEQLPQYQGKTENIKTKIKEMIEDEGHPEEDFEKLLQEIAFSSQLNATHKDVVDSFYINQLLKAIQLNEAGAVEKFEKEIQQKDPQIQKMYHTLKDQLVNTTEEIDVAQLKETSIQNEIQRQLQKEAEEFGLSFDFLQSAMNEYQGDKKTIPYLTHLLDSMTLSKEEFEAKTGEKYRRRTKVLEERLRQNFEQIQKWKEEL
jgi:type I restriction enzyme R subunit